MYGDLCFGFLICKLCFVDGQYKGFCVCCLHLVGVSSLFPFFFFVDLKSSHVLTMPRSSCVVCVCCFLAMIFAESCMLVNFLFVWYFSSQDSVKP